MDRRERLIQAVTTLITIAVAVLAARFGIPIPPAPAPIVEMPPIIIPPGTLPPGAPNPDTSPDPANAIVRLSFKGVGCSATVIGPRRQDGRWFVLTAAHCCESVGQSGTIRFLDGRTTGVHVLSFDRKSDSAWLVTEDNSSTFPFALLAPASPAVGTKVWHAGYGVDRPGNKEVGEVLSGPDANGQIRMRLSVSSGDSGGGIISNERGEVVSCVCCTAARGIASDVWGTSPESALRSKPTTMVLDDWVPIEVPLRMPK